MSVQPPLDTSLAAPASANYLAQAMAKLNRPPPNLFPMAPDPNDPFHNQRGMPASAPIKTNSPATALNKYGYAPLTAAAQTTPPATATPPAQSPAPGAPPNTNDATAAYGQQVQPDVDKAVVDALAAQQSYVPYVEKKVDYTEPVKDPNAKRHGIASAIELLAAAKSPKIMPALDKQIDYQQKDQAKDYNERVENARAEYQRAVDEQARLGRESASHEALLEKRVQVALAAKNLHDANLERAQRDTLAHQVAQQRADTWASSVINANARRDAMSKEAIARDQETARYHAAIIGVRNTALADQMQETKWRVAGELQARGVSSATALQIANQRQNLALAMESLRERAADKREFQREGFAASMKATGELLASYDKTIKDASSLTATPEQKLAAQRLLSQTTGPDGKPAPSPYDQIVSRLQTQGVSMPPQDETTQVQQIQSDAYAGAMSGAIDPNASQPGGMDPASVAAMVAAAVGGAVNARGPAGGPGGPTSPAIQMNPQGQPGFPGQPAGPQPNAAKVASNAGFNDDKGRTDVQQGRISPAMLNALNVAEGAGYKLQITAVRSDHGDDGQGGHAGGNAADIGAINGVTVGWNPVTYKFIGDAIGSRTVSVIGTIPQIANDPKMQAWAKQNGVTLRVDEGTGPHIHMQVAGGGVPPGGQPPGQTPGQNPPGGRPPMRANPLRPGPGAAPGGGQPGGQNPTQPPTQNLATIPPATVAQQAVAAYDRDPQLAGQPFDAAWGAMSQHMKSKGLTAQQMQAAEDALRAHIKQRDAARDQQAEIEQRTQALKAAGVPQAGIDAAVAQIKARQHQAAAPPAAPSVPPAQFATQQLTMLRQMSPGMNEGQRRQQVLARLAAPPYNLNPQMAQAALAQALNGAQQPALAAAR